LEGSVQVYVEVQADGATSPEHMMVAHDLGMGLDKKAVGEPSVIVARHRANPPSALAIALGFSVEGITRLTRYDLETRLHCRNLTPLSYFSPRVGAVNRRRRSGVLSYYK
jgi:hypothetical protein